MALSKCNNHEMFFDSHRLIPEGRKKRKKELSVYQVYRISSRIISRIINKTNKID